MRGFALLGAAFASIAGCAAIADFQDFTADCPSGKPGCHVSATGGETSSGGALASGGGGSGGEPGGAVGSGGEASSGGADSGGLPGGGGAGAGGTACEDAPGLHGPPMSLVARDDGSFFWIDQTEVTVGQFADFLATGAPLRGAVCEGDAGAGPSQCEETPAPSDPDMPRTCVDWCEADGFCAWAGKELCRDDAESGSAASRGDLLRRSDFYAACSPTPRAVYGCAEGCVPSACNGAEANRGIVPVRSFPACCVGDACGQSCAIADLSGNVSEWTGACKPLTAEGACVVRGGDFESTDAELECHTVTGELPRRKKYRTVGFRCCVPVR